MQLILRCLRIPAMGDRKDMQKILEVFENELKAKGILKEERKPEVTKEEFQMKQWLGERILAND